MDINTIKKELYKQKPKARILNVTKSGILYSTTIQQKKTGLFGTIVQHVPIRFLVPLSEIGDVVFGPEGVESQLLNRYIVMPETTTP